MQQTLDQLREFFTEGLLQLLVPLGILVVGWLIALVLSSITRKGLNKTSLDERVAEMVVGPEKANRMDTGRWGARVVYWVVLVLVAVAVLESLQLTSATEPLTAMLGGVLAYVPKLFGAAAILGVAWLVATLVRRVLGMAFKRWDIDERLVSETGTDTQEGEAAPSIGAPIAEAAYWLVFLLFVPAVLDALQLQGMLRPVEGMVDEVLGFVPNLASAALILVVGWFIARVVRRVSQSLLAGIGADRLTERTGLDKALGERKLSSVVAAVAYGLVLIPVAIGTLNALQLESITAPASEMLATFFEAVPALIGASLLLVIAWVVARLLKGVTENVLTGVGFNSLLDKIGLTAERTGEWKPSRVVGGIVVVAVMLFASIEAAALLGFGEVATLATDVTELAGHILLGLVVFGVGLFLARAAADGVKGSGIQGADTLALTARAAVVILAGAMALRQMGIADEIIELGFAITLGSAGIAAALAFGLGGRETAGRMLEDLRQRFQGDPGRGAEQKRAVRAAR